MSSTIYSKLKNLKQRLETVPATVQELSAYLACNQRTVFRHLKTLEEENIGLCKTKESGQSVQYFIESKTPATQNRDIIRSLKNISEELSSHGEIRYTKTLRDTIQTLKGNNSTSEKVHTNSTCIDPNFIIDPGPFAEFKTNETRVDNYLTAIRNYKKMELVYEHGRNGKKERIIVCPLKLVLRMGTLYLIYNNEGSNKKPLILVFSRIRQEKLLKKSFSPIPVDMKAFYKYHYGKWSASLKQGSPLHILLAVKSPWLQAQFRESNFNPPAKIREKEGKMEVELNLYKAPDMLRWLISLHPDIQILSPRSLVDDIQNELNLIQKSLKK